MYMMTYGHTEVHIHHNLLKDQCVNLPMTLSIILDPLWMIAIIRDGWMYPWPLSNETAPIFCEVIHNSSLLFSTRTSRVQPAGAGRPSLEESSSWEPTEHRSRFSLAALAQVRQRLLPSGTGHQLLLVPLFPWTLGMERPRGARGIRRN